MHWVKIFKDFFETNSPRGGEIGVFRWFYFGLFRSKPKILYLDSRFHGNDNFNGNPEAEPRGILFD